MKIRFKVRTERVIVLVVGLVLAIAIIQYVESIQKSSIIYLKVNAKQVTKPGEPNIKEIPKGDGRQ